MTNQAYATLTSRVRLSVILLLICGASAMHSYGRESEQSVRQRRYLLWLQYEPLTQKLQTDYSTIIKSIYCPGNSPILLNARSELLTATEKLTGGKVKLSKSVDQDGTVLVGTVRTFRKHVPESLVGKAEALKDEGYVIESVRLHGKKATVITSKTEAGVLYGTFHFVRLMQTGQPIDSLSLAEEPAVDLRMLNHWDNLSGSVERGYAGKSLWNWDELPDKIDSRYNEYARFCASIGINATVLNNVNADPRILRKDYLEKVAVLAGIFRKWGIRTYLSANYAAPLPPSKTPNRMKRWGGVGNVNTADPKDPRVQKWWKTKADEIYALIPDFGGFLVKADSEGMPGPKTYKRSHAEGANMLADALKPHGGVLLWRAFVYGKSKDRASDAYNEFKKYDGKFRSNVFLQVKNGPIDFQPREPFTPLFGAMPKTDLAMEIQITKEYLGFSTTLAYLAPMWSETLHSDTYAKGKGSTVAHIVDGSLDNRPKSCIAGVANVGHDEDWCGSVFNQANWYAFGRLAWGHQLKPEMIADEWVSMTFPTNPQTRDIIKRMMLGSYEAYVNYSMPMGLNILCDGGHYKPGPAGRRGYHKADKEGLGFDRTKKGSKYVDQYHPEVAAIFNDIDKTPLDYLLWFHHVPWHYKLTSGRTLWQELNVRYDKGVATVDAMAETWKTIEGKVDEERYKSVMKTLTREKAYSRLWRKACLTYFAQFATANKAGE